MTSGTGSAWFASRARGHASPPFAPRESSGWTLPAAILLCLVGGIPGQPPGQEPGREPDNPPASRPAPLAEWTPDRLQSETAGFLAICEQALDRADGRLRVQAKGTTRSQLELQVFLEKLAYRRAFTANALAELKEYYRLGEQGIAPWPLLFRGLRLDRNQAEDTILGLHRERRRLQAQADRVQEVIQDLEDQDPGVWLARERLKEARALLASMRTRLAGGTKAAALARELEILQGAAAYAATVAARSQAPPTAEELAATRLPPGKEPTFAEVMAEKDA